MKKAIILASASPRRHELLDLIGINHKIIPCNENEEKLTNDKNLLDKDAPSITEKVIEQAKQKALCVSKSLNDEEKKNAIILGADTIVVLKGEIIGKPDSKEDAFEMLAKLCGETHEVYTGICLINLENDSLITGIEKTLVNMLPWEESRIRKYIDEEYVLDKAGAYAIQGKGAAMINHIEGCFYNVMGLPLSKLVSMLDELGIDFLNDE